jgi:serine/threonine protein kinase
VQFGISRARDPNKTSITTECVGTWAYMAPEQFSNRVSEKVDVYAFGVCIWEIWTRQRPWQDLINDSPWQLVIAIMNDDERLPIPPSLPSPLRKLVEDCWKADPRARPNMSEVPQAHFTSLCFPLYIL